MLDCRDLAFSLLLDRAATGGARLNLEARALAEVYGVKVERRGARGARNTLSARTPPPYNHPRSHRACTSEIDAHSPRKFRGRVLSSGWIRPVSISAFPVFVDHGG